MRSRDKLILIVAIVLGLVALTAGLAVAASGGGADNPAIVSDTPEESESGAGEAKDDEGSDDDASEGTDESDGSLTGDTAAKASDAALASTGGGTVTAVESDDGGERYEVEIRMDDGTEAEVELDKDFKVVQRAEDD